ncbi:MAG: FAD-dependent oxidoreductase [Rhodospirillales bacterium]|nr:FAD-dependent oxidoreductase [Rhodospirillales bacterium]
MDAAPPPAFALRLGFGLDFAALASRAGLIALDGHFLAYLHEADPSLHHRLLAARAAPETLEAPAESALILALGPVLDAFLGLLIPPVAAPLAALAEATAARDPVHGCKRNFVQRQAVKTYPDPAGFDGPALAAALAVRIGATLSEENFAAAVAAWEEAGDHDALDLAMRYAAWASLTPNGQAAHPGGILFRVPKKLDPAHLVAAETVMRDGVRMLALPAHDWRARDGFALTDPGMTTAQALDQMNYCIWCHAQAKDSCRHGLKDRQTGGWRKSAHGIDLAGCPLEERISEMHSLRAQGHVLGAFATIALDNPMMAATGHRICNDCMKACIYQKQAPVDIPQAETAILREVLALPYGFELYALLTRWNPLDCRRPLPRPPSGRKVLVVGLGPAGFTLAHHLLNDGHAVLAVDGLKIEPLGFDPAAPVADAMALAESLDDRVMAGFGGVAEYGITVRWNKNYLKLVRLLLERRSDFALSGGVRFGGAATLSLDDAFAAGFDHVALCMGAGRPTVLDIPNALARGVRQASDFLMALQLTGAAKRGSIANLQLRLPVVVIGGGLTAIDTATEALAYYVRQVEKFAARHAVLAAAGRADLATLSEEDRAIAGEFLAHAAAIAAERAEAAREGRAPRLAQLLDGWGGATIAYRRALTEAPSYTLNHEEVEKALEEGVRFAEGLTPEAVEVDRWGHACAVVLRGRDGAAHRLPAGAILVAAGTQPNTVLAREDARITLDGRYFQAIDAHGDKVAPPRGLAKPERAEVLMHRWPDGRFVSFFGDLHPSFAGNVVKAMAGAKRGYPVVSAMLGGREPASAEAAGSLLARMRADLSAHVHAVHRLTPTIVEVVLHAPAAARAFRPGQFYRLQNFEQTAPRVAEPGMAATILAMEGLAMTGAWTDPEAGLVSVIALEMGGSSDLCATLRPGEAVVLMGPTGTPTEIHAGTQVLLAGGGLGNAVLFSIGAALRAAGSKVLYFAGYKEEADRYKTEEIERAADVIVWCCDRAPGFVPNPARPQDRAFVGNIVEAMAAYGEGRLGECVLALAASRHLIAIGSDRMMQAVGAARHGVLAPFLAGLETAIGSINSPMQCMMKEVCAQCLQAHIDPATGARSVVFSCFNQDQALDRVDFPLLHERLGQNRLAEWQTGRWVDRALRAAGARP